MSDNISVDLEQDGNEPEIVVKIKLEDIFNKIHCHPEHDPGKVIYYVIKVDKSEFEVKAHKMTGKELLALVNKTPENYRLFELGHNQREIMPDEYVDFRKEGIERFKSVAKHANEGNEATQRVASPFRRELILLQEDVKFLDTLNLNWETFMYNNVGYILIHDFSIPDGYNESKTLLALIIPPSYPTVEFDMMYFFPHISRKDTNPINALTTHNIDGKIFQRWSRHRNAGEWISGVDNLETHILSISSWLKDELKK